MRALLIAALSLPLGSCFSTADFSSCTGPFQCGPQGDSDRVYICQDGQCIDPQPEQPLVQWSPGVPSNQPVLIDLKIALGAGITAGEPLIIQHPIIVIGKDGLIELAGAGHPGGGGGGGGAGAGELAAMGNATPGNGGTVDGRSGDAGSASSGGAGGAGRGPGGGAGGAGDAAEPFAREQCPGASTGSPGKAGMYDLANDTAAVFDPCAPLSLSALPMGSGGGGGGGGRGGGTALVSLGGGGGGVGYAGAGALVLRATQYIEIRSVLSAVGRTGGEPPACTTCSMGDGGEGASETVGGARGDECAGGAGGGGAGGLIYIEAPLVIFGRNAFIEVGGSLGAANGGHVIIRGEVEGMPNIGALDGGLPIGGFAQHAGDAPLVCTGPYDLSGLR